MDKQQICTKLVTDVLGLDFSVSSFQDRLIFQKAIYLAQAAGVNLGYYYSWYLHGPYCSALASDGFAVQNEIAQGHDESREWKLDAASIANLQRLKPLFQADSDGERARKLELLASNHFLIKRKQVSEATPEKLSATLRRFKKLFPIEEIAEALRELKTYGLLT